MSNCCCRLYQDALKEEILDLTGIFLAKERINDKIIITSPRLIANILDTVHWMSICTLSTKYSLKKWLVNGMAREYAEINHQIILDHVYKPSTYTFSFRIDFQILHTSFPYHNYKGRHTCPGWCGLWEMFSIPIKHFYCKSLYFHTCPQHNTNIIHKKLFACVLCCWLVLSF